MHELHRVLLDAADGRFPAADGLVDVLAPMVGDHHAVVEFTGHAIVLTDLDPSELRRRGADGFGGASQPDVVRWLAGPDGWVGSHDVVLAATGTGDGRLPQRHDLDDHPRTIRSRAHRRDVRVYGDVTGLITVGRGLVDRWEVSVEVIGDAPAGSGRRLVRESLGVIPHGEIVFAQVAPGNARSLRAFLSCGFAPIGAETLLLPRRGDAGDRAPDTELEHG